MTPERGPAPDLSEPPAWPERAVASDARSSLEAFRASGAVSFHLLGVEKARERYTVACRQSGPRPVPVEQVTDLALSERVTVRLYDPRPTRDLTPTPLILFVHGGGWVIGDLDTHDGICRRLAAGTGLPVVAVGYRLAPEHPYPAALHDCREALRWVEGDDLPHIRSSGTILVGDSAGGQLAAILARESALQAGPRPVAAQVLIYPVTDLRIVSPATWPSYDRMTHGFPLVADTMRWFAGLYLAGDPDRSAADLSPLAAEVPPGLAPALICTVDNDPLADEGISYAAALAGAGVPVQLVHRRGYAHGLLTSAGAIPEGEKLLTQIIAFIDTIATEMLAEV